MNAVLVGADIYRRGWQLAAVTSSRVAGVIRRLLRLVIRLGLLAGVGLALSKLLQGRRTSELGTPSPHWAPPPAPSPDLPKPSPEPELVKPVMLEEVLEKSKPAPPAPAQESVVKKAAPAKKVAEKAPPPAKKAAPVKKAAKKQP